MNTFESAPSTVSSTSRPVSDDGTGFAITLVLVVVAFLLGAAALADVINQAG